MGSEMCIRDRGASTKTGFLNSGKYRVGFSAHGNEAVFRVGYPGNHKGTALFSVSRIPTPKGSRNMK